MLKLDFFFSCSLGGGRILRWLEDEEEEVKAATYQPRIQFLIVEMSRKQFSTSILLLIIS